MADSADLWTRLKERKLVQWTLAYGAGAWLTREIVSGVASVWGWPGALLRVLDVLLVVGLLATAVLAWYHGEKGRQRASGVELTLLATLLVIAGLGITLVQRGGDPEVAREARVASIRPQDLDVKRIAVLPFRNANAGDEPSESFALGVHDDLLTRLSTIDGLRVISRTSVGEYADTEKGIPQIAAELGAGTIIEGGVQRAGDAVRINVQLIDGRTDEHVWAETYDRRWSMENLFAIQTEIAEEVARKLRIALTREDRESLSRAPTRDALAFQRYAEARDAFWRGEFEEAIALARTATARDPEFARAWALEAIAHVSIYHHQETPSARSPERLEGARAALVTAERLAPRDPDVLVARGQFEYHGFLNYERATEAFERALAEDPSNALAFNGLAAVRRRQGRVEEAVEGFRRAVELDPRSDGAAADYALSLAAVRRYAEALPALDGAGVRREADIAYGALLGLLAGDRAVARAYLERLPTGGASAVAARTLVALTGRDFPAARAALDGSDGPWVQIDPQFALLPLDLWEGDALRYAGAADAARDRYESAVRRLELWLEDQPEDERAWGALGRALAGLGRADAAIAAAERGVELMPYGREALRGAQRLDDLARVHARLGNDLEAITILEDLMRKPAGMFVSRATLGAEPEWDTIREHPRFQALFGRGDRVGG